MFCLRSLSWQMAFSGPLLSSGSSTWPRPLAAQDATWLCALAL